MKRVMETLQEMDNVFVLTHEQTDLNIVVDFNLYSPYRWSPKLKGPKIGKPSLHQKHLSTYQCSQVFRGERAVIRNRSSDVSSELDGEAAVNWHEWKFGPRVELEPDPTEEAHGSKRLPYILSEYRYNRLKNSWSY